MKIPPATKQNLLEKVHGNFIDKKFRIWILDININFEATQKNSFQVNYLGK